MPWLALAFDSFFCRKHNRKTVLAALASIVCFAVSDTALHVDNYSKIGGTSRDSTCFAVLVRSLVQVAICLGVNVFKRRPPWGSSGYRVLLIVIVSREADEREMLSLVRGK